MAKSNMHQCVASHCCDIMQCSVMCVLRVLSSVSIMCCIYIQEEPEEDVVTGGDGGGGGGGGDQEVVLPGGDPDAGIPAEQANVHGTERVPPGGGGEGEGFDPVVVREGLDDIDEVDSSTVGGGGGGGGSEEHSAGTQPRNSD